MKSKFGLMALRGALVGAFVLGTTLASSATAQAQDPGFGFLYGYSVGQARSFEAICLRLPTSRFIHPFTTVNDLLGPTGTAPMHLGRPFNPTQTIGLSLNWKLDKRSSILVATHQEQGQPDGDSRPTINANRTWPESHNH